MLPATVFAAAVFLARSAPIAVDSRSSIAAVHADILKRNSKTASTTKITAVSNAEPTGYIIANVCAGSKDCSTASTMRVATGTGVCFTAYANETAIGSTSYEFESADKDHIVVNNGMWESLDCSGTPDITTMPIPVSCLPTEGKDQSIIYSYSATPEPWTFWDHGLMFQYFDDEKECKSSTDGVGNSFLWLELGVCTTNSVDGTSSMFDSCGDGKSTITLYSDAHCSAKSTTGSIPLDVCVLNADDDDQYMNTNIYSTMICY